MTYMNSVQGSMMTKRVSFPHMKFLNICLTSNELLQLKTGNCDSTKFSNSFHST